MSTLSDQELTIHLPPADVDGLEQDEEYFEFDDGDARRRVRCHDYGEIYSVPGLYEQLFAEKLSCKSPEVVIGLLRDALHSEDEDPGELRVLDLGAGNGMVAEELDEIGVDSIIGVDLLEEAKEAAMRDRPGLYDAYHAADLTDLDPDAEQDLSSRQLNGLTCVAALGFGDIPPEAFSAAYDFLEPGSWIAFNIRDQFISDEDGSGFARLLKRMVAEDKLVEHDRMRYTHRLSVSGDPIHYVAVVSQKADGAA